MTSVPQNQIKYRKRIGSSGKNPIFEIGTIGGLVLVAKQDSTKLKVLGSGSHKCLARFLAKKYEPELQIDMLEKSEEGDIRDFEEFIPFWDQVTVNLRSK